jgi:CHASE3 domain sensor protein
VFAISIKAAADPGTELADAPLCPIATPVAWKQSRLRQSSLDFGSRGLCVCFSEFADLAQARSSVRRGGCSHICEQRYRIRQASRDRNGQNWRVHTTDVLDTLETALEGMLDQESSLRGYLISGNEEFLEPYHRGGNNFSSAIHRLKDLTSDNPAEQRRLDELNELAKTWRLEVAERELALMAKLETREDAHKLEASGSGKTATDLIRAKVDEIDSVERDLLANREVVQKQAYATAYMMTILGGAASLLIAVLMGALLTRAITAPITRMTGAMAALAKGDTGIEVPGIGRATKSAPWRRRSRSSRRA